MLAEAWRDRLTDDLPRLGVRQRGLEPVANLESQLSVLDEHDEEDAVVEAFLAEAPLLEERARDVLQILTLERSEHRDRHLRARGSLALGQERFEPRALGRRQEPGVVVHPAGRYLRQNEGDGEDSREEQART